MPTETAYQSLSEVDKNRVDEAVEKRIEEAVQKRLKEWEENQKFFRALNLFKKLRPSKKRIEEAKKDFKLKLDYMIRATEKQYTPLSKLKPLDLIFSLCKETFLLLQCFSLYQ